MREPPETESDATESHVLVVENQGAFLAFLRDRVEGIEGLRVQTVTSLEEAKDALARRARFLACVTNLTLSGAEDGEMVEVLEARGVPTIVLTGHYSAEIRARMLRHRNVVDYVLKRESGLDEMETLLRRLRTNPRVAILVVDPDPASRREARTLLELHNYTVDEACDGREALERMRGEPETGMVVTADAMPSLDGLELVAQLRKRNKPERLCIIGCVASGSRDRVTRFLKQGANDVVEQPLHREEFLSRVAQNATMMEYIRRLEEAAYRDYLTRLHNRKYFFEHAPPAWEEATRARRPVAVAMLDIDHFKKINDTFGHDAGDAALQHLARMLRSHFRDVDIVARFGGEEFCIFMKEIVPATVRERLDAFRGLVETTPCFFEETRIDFTLSIGACVHEAPSLETMIRAADQALYQAKEGGRNRVVLG